MKTSLILVCYALSIKPANCSRKNIHTARTSFGGELLLKTLRSIQIVLSVTNHFEHSQKRNKRVALCRGGVIFLSIVVMKNNYIPLMNSPVYRDGTHPLATQTDSTSRAATVARLLHLELWFLEKNRDNLQINRSSPSHPNLSNHEYLT